MRGLVAGTLLVVCSTSAVAQSVSTYGYDARGRLTAMRSGIGVRSDYDLDAADNRSNYHAAQQFATAYAAASLPHIVGYADGGGWAANAGTVGHMTYGPLHDVDPGRQPCGDLAAADRQQQRRQ